MDSVEEGKSTVYLTTRTHGERRRPPRTKVESSMICKGATATTLDVHFQWSNCISTLAMLHHLITYFKMYRIAGCRHWPRQNANAYLATSPKWKLNSWIHLVTQIHFKIEWASDLANATPCHQDLWKLVRWVLRNPAYRKTGTNYLDVSGTLTVFTSQYARLSID